MLPRQAPDIFEKTTKYTRLNDVVRAGLYSYFRPLDGVSEEKVFFNGKWLVSIASNDYLGLAQHPKVKQACVEAINKYGSSCAGSRYINGTFKVHVELEEKLASMFNKEAALVFATGFLTNLGVISALGGKEDRIFCDRENHASILDGCRLSFSKTLKFKHNDPGDLERLLSLEANKFGKLVIVDGVFSMSGDICGLPRVVAACEKHSARLMVDEAHGLGVLGKNGKGTAEHFDVLDKVDIVMGTFSKTLASIGGFIASSKVVVDFVKHVSREIIFTAALPPASAAAVLAALEIMEKEPERRTVLLDNVRYIANGLKELGFRIGDNGTAVIPIYIGGDERTLKMGKLLEEEGVFANVILSPAVSPGDELIRTSYKATHTKEDLDFVLSKFEKVGKALEIIR